MAARIRLPYAVFEIQPVPREISIFGACTTAVDPDLFFSEEQADQQAAKALCNVCPMTARCLSYAAANEAYGVWGGTTAQERTGQLGAQIVTPEARIEAHNIRAAIESQNLTVKEIADKFCVTERTVYRYKARLRGASESSLLAQSA